MFIDISDLFKRKSSMKELNMEIEHKGFNDGIEEIAFKSPVRIDGEFAMIDNVLNLKAVVSAELELTCSRCLQKFTYPIEIKINEKFSNEEVNKDDDAIFINSDVLDITEIIDNNIIMALPIKRLCNENCKGLCQECGTNLNFSTCKCKKEDVDPRLEKLKDFFATN